MVSALNLVEASELVYTMILQLPQCLAKEYNQRVLIINTDAHHGDGTQWSFYADNHVLLIIHETGKFFPRLWSLYCEHGEDIGYGRTVDAHLNRIQKMHHFWLIFKLTVEPIGAKSF
ncbi:hypothetical protein ACV56Z_17680 [Staphylococcus aureus]